MNIVVLLRSVPDAVEELPLVDGAIDWDDVALKFNEFDDHALEEAVLIKEESGADVTAVALASAGDRILQMALARGADRAVRIEADVDEGISSRAAAPLYAEAIQSVGADLVLTGVQAPGDMFGQLAPFVAAKLGWPQLNGATSVQGAPAGIAVVQEYGGGRSARLSVSLPAVVSVQAGRQAPRYVSGTRLRQVVQASSIEKLAVTAGPDAEPATLIRLEPAAKARSVVFLGEDPDAAADQIAEILMRDESHA